MQVEFYLAGEITQVTDSITWVRCASGNVLIPAPTAVSLVVKALVWWQHLHSWLIDPQVQVSPIGGGRQELCSRSSPEEDCTKAVGILSGALHLPIIWS